MVDENSGIESSGGYGELITAMVRTGVVGYGGGPAILPLIRHEAVTRYHWISDEEFAEVVALANTLPGPIATKMAAYMGYRRKRVLGAIVAIIANILPSCVAVIALLGAMMAFKHSKVLHDMIGAVEPVIVVLLGSMAYDFAKKARAGLGKWLALAFGAIAFLLLYVLKVPDAVVVLCFLAYGAFHFRIRAKRGDSK